MTVATREPDWAKARTDLLRITRSFDFRVDGRRARSLTLLGMGLHGIQVFREIDAIADVQPLATIALLRSLVDLAILVRWIEASPKLRVAMWLADDERDRLRLLAGHGRIMTNRGLQPVEVFPARQRAIKTRYIDRIRRLALLAGEPIRRGSSQPLLPSVEDRASAVKDSVELSAMFMTFSVPVHHGARAFARDRFVARIDGMHLEARARLRWAVSGSACDHDALHAPGSGEPDPRARSSSRARCDPQ